MAEQKGCITGDLTATTGTSGGGMLSLANPEGATLFITEVVFDITTEATGAATADVGVAANGTTSSDTLMDGVDVGAAAIVANNHKHAGTNGMSIVKWTSSQYVTATASATLAGLVGTYHISYIRS